jgi:hypothetical protein
LIAVLDSLVCCDSDVQIADKEVSRKEEISKALEVIRNLVGQLDVVESIPTDVERRQSIINRAMDVRSACMSYLGAQLNHQANRLRLLGMLEKCGQTNFQDGC